MASWAPTSPTVVQLSASAATDVFAATVPTVVPVVFVWCGTGSNTVRLYILPSGGSAQEILSADMELGDRIRLPLGLPMVSGDKIQGDATNGSQVTCVIGKFIYS